MFYHHHDSVVDHHIHRFNEKAGPTHAVKTLCSEDSRSVTSSLPYRFSSSTASENRLLSLLSHSATPPAVQSTATSSDTIQGYHTKQTKAPSPNYYTENPPHVLGEEAHSVFMHAFCHVLKASCGLLLPMKPEKSYPSLPYPV